MRDDQQPHEEPPSPTYVVDTPKKDRELTVKIRESGKQSQNPRDIVSLSALHFSSSAQDKSKQEIATRDMEKEKPSSLFFGCFCGS